MIEALAWLSEEGADDCCFGGAISSRESCESFDVVSHESASPRRTRSTRRKEFSSRQERQVRIRHFFFAAFAFFAGDIPIPAPRRFERLERFERIGTSSFPLLRWHGNHGAAIFAGAQFFIA